MRLDLLKLPKPPPAQEQKGYCIKIQISK